MTPAEQPLKPCPFCGSEPERNHAHAWCDGTPDVPHGLVTQSWDIWNRRALTPLETAALAYVARDTEPLSVAYVECREAFSAAAEAVRKGKENG